MASIFGHAVSGIALAKLSFSKTTWKLLLCCMACTIIPDADVIMFAFGVEYESPFGHRGFTHSILFAVILAFTIKFLFYRGIPPGGRKGIGLIFLFFVCTISHGLLDAMTTGGLGVGFFTPFYNERYFFPFRPIKVSPIGAGKFFSEWGLRVLKSEMIWIGIPSTILILIRYSINFFRSRK